MTDLHPHPGAAFGRRDEVRVRQRRGPTRRDAKRRRQQAPSNGGRYKKTPRDVMVPIRRETETRMVSDAMVLVSWQTFILPALQ